MDVSIIIVNYNVREFLEQALRSVFMAGRDLEIEVFVVDNNSVDGSPRMVREQFPQVRLITNNRNVGFSRANNQAIAQATGKYLLLLNPDTILQEDTLHALIGFMESHPDAGAAGCRILNPDGTFAPESRRAFPTPAVAFYRMVGLSHLFPRSRVFGRYNLTYLPDDEQTEVDALSGSCMFLRRAAIYHRRETFERHAANGTVPCASEEIPGDGPGMLDEDFFMYGEDLDWCYRIQHAGWKICYTPDTQIIHYKGECTKKGELRYVRLFYGAMLRFSEKHFAHRHSGFFAFLVRMGIHLRAGLSMASKALHAMRRPAVEFLLMFAAGAAGAGVWHVASDGSFPAGFFLAVPGAYALAAVVGIGVAGGYRPARRSDPRTALLGITAAFVFVALFSFFLRDVAFSRGVLVLGFLFMAAAVAGFRLLRERNFQGPRRTILVGPPREAQRLQRMLHGVHDRYRLVGFVDTTAESSEARAVGELDGLGTVRQVRDIVRLNEIEEVIFASDGLTNNAIFSMILQLRGLPVHTRILAEGRNVIIGKSIIDNLDEPPMVEAEQAVGHPRSIASRRAFDIALSLLLLPLWPLTLIIIRGRRTSRLSSILRAVPSILTGKRAFVGFNERARIRPPLDWGIPEGVVSIPHVFSSAEKSPRAIRKAYWHYVQNQSALLDLKLIWRHLAGIRKPKHRA